MKADKADLHKFKKITSVARLGVSVEQHTTMSPISHSLRLCVTLLLQNYLRRSYCEIDTACTLRVLRQVRYRAAVRGPKMGA